MLDDPNISRKHAELRRSGQGDWQIVDLGSTNGVKVNGRRVSLGPALARRRGHPRNPRLLLRHRAVRPPRMSDLEPLAVALKFGFLAVLYLFLLWVTRMALRDLRGDRDARAARPATTRSFPASRARRDRRLADRRGGRRPDPGRALRPLRRALARPLPGRRHPARRPLRVRDPRAGLQPIGRATSSRTWARPTGPCSTPQELHGEAELRPGDKIRIGDTEFTFEAEPAPMSPDAGHRRRGLQDRHGPPAERERGLLLRALAASSRSPTGWAAPRPARSRRGSPPARSSAARPTTTAPRRSSSGSPSRPTARSTSSPSATPRARGWARPSPPRWSATTRSRSATSATAAPTSCATAS